MTGLFILGGIFVFALLILAGMYNSLVGKRNQIHNIVGTGPESDSHGQGLCRP
jgi:hypothetical protein